MGSKDNRDGSLFQIGSNVSFNHLLAFLSVLVFVIILLEHLLHQLEKKAEHYRKYEEMLSKVYRELMVLGLIGLVIKIFKELYKVDTYNRSLIAFQAADLTIFILAVVLIIQAICVHVLLRRKHFLVDRAELISTADLVEALSLRDRTERTTEVSTSSHSSHSSPSIIYHQYNALDQIAQFRVLRHLFLRRYGLPEMFPFSKYLRQAQDNQITNMIDVHVSTWLFLITVAWGLDGATVFLGHHKESYALAVILGIFAWTSLVIHVGVACYLKHCVTLLLHAGGYTTNRYNMIPSLQAIARDEIDTLRGEFATDALEMMQQVQERQEIRARHQHQAYLVDDVGFQLIWTCLRYISKIWTVKSKELHLGDQNDLDVPMNHTNHNSTPHRRRSTLLPIRIRWFSRKFWHFVVMMLMMVNAFYIALVCQCVLYQIKLMMKDVGILAILCFPIPGVLNTLVFQPMIFDNFMIVSSIFRVDALTLSEVVTHFSETVEIRSEFACALLDGMRHKQRSISDLARNLDRQAVKGTNVIEVEQLRIVLRDFGFHLSHFRFNSVAKLLFELKGTKVDYTQVLRLVTLAEAENHNEPVPSSYRVLLRQSSLTAADEEFHDNDGEMEEVLSYEGYVPPTVATGSNHTSHQSSNTQGFHRASSGFHLRTNSQQLYALYHIDSNVDLLDLSVHKDV